MTDEMSRSWSSTNFSAELKPVLEPLPKWEVLAEVLEEIEQDAYLNPLNPTQDSNGTIWVCGARRLLCVPELAAGAVEEGRGIGGCVAAELAGEGGDASRGDFLSAVRADI